MNIVNVAVEQKSEKFEDLDAGQCFKFSKNGTSIYIKTDYDQDAVNLTDGDYCSDLCGKNVYPVNAEVHIID